MEPKPEHLVEVEVCTESTLLNRDLHWSLYISWR